MRVVELRKRSVQIPGGGETAALFRLQALKFLDQVEFEFHGNPGGELERDVFVRERATATTSSRQQADRSSGFNPLRRREARNCSNPLEF